MNFQINNCNKIFNPIIRQVENKAEKDKVKKLRFNHSIIIYTLDGNKYNYTHSLNDEIFQFNCNISFNCFLRKQRNDDKEISYKYFLKGEEDQVRRIINDSTKNDIILFALPYVKDYYQFQNGEFKHKTGDYIIVDRSPCYIHIKYKYGDGDESWGEVRRMKILTNWEQEEYINHQGDIIYPEELEIIRNEHMLNVDW
jgi:hypothetical protein